MRYVLAVCLLLAACAPEDVLVEQGRLQARAELMTSTGDAIGSALLTETGEGVNIRVNISDFDEWGQGLHGFHIHEIGACDRPGFETAGAHFNPFGRRHGLETPQGPHAGDLPNMEVIGGEANAVIRAPLVTLREGPPNSLFRGNGTALIIHEGVDDHVSDPSGNAGARVACGVVKNHRSSLANARSRPMA